MKTNENSIGVLTQMIHQGSKVISRKSMKIRVPYKAWDSKLNRVKRTFPDADLINREIEKVSQVHNNAKFRIPDGDDRQCVLEYINKMNEKDKANLIKPITTSLKYQTIIKNFEFVVKNTFKMNSLPFGKLREKEFIHSLKTEIRKVRKKNGGFKKHKSWFNYMSVFGTFVNHWNTNSGTQFPINTRMFTSDIPKDDRKFATILSIEELCRLEEYQPKGYRGGAPQLLAKNIFLFQYYSGGIRIQDALTLTNKQIKSEGIEIRIKKSKLTQLFGFCYEQVESLRTYYEKEYNIAESTCIVKNLNLKAHTILELNRVEGVGDIKEFKIPEIRNVLRMLHQKSKLNSELFHFIQPFTEVLQLLKDEMSRHFFELVRKLPQRFLFPKLNWEDFKNVFGENESGNINERQAYLIHRASTSHNSNLKRISLNLGLENIGGHTPRHTLANHLYNDNNSVEVIQDILVHSEAKTTKIYLRERHGNPQVRDTLKQTREKLRLIKEQIDLRGH